MSNTYALYVDPDVPDEVRESLRTMLQTDERILAWWNHLPSLYLLTSRESAPTLSKAVASVVKPWSFLVIRVDPADSQGWLPERAWRWIQRRYA